MATNTYDYYNKNREQQLTHEEQLKVDSITFAITCRLYAQLEKANAEVTKFFNNLASKFDQLTVDIADQQKLGDKVHRLADLHSRFDNLFSRYTLATNPEQTFALVSGASVVNKQQSLFHAATPKKGFDVVTAPTIKVGR